MFAVSRHGDTTRRAFCDAFFGGCFWKVDVVVARLFRSGALRGGVYFKSAVQMAEGPVTDRSLSDCFSHIEPMRMLSDSSIDDRSQTAAGPTPGGRLARIHQSNAPGLEPPARPPHLPRDSVLRFIATDSGSMANSRHGKSGLGISADAEAERAAAASEARASRAQRRKARDRQRGDLTGLRAVLDAAAAADDHGDRAFAALRVVCRAASIV